jgi:Protein of unknown function (DUF3352)
MPKTMRSSRPVLSLLAAAAAALAIAACGDDSGGGGGGDLASLAPAETPVYVQGVVRPDGDLRSNVEAMVDDVAGIDAGQQIVNQIDAGLAEQQLTWEDDISPWLGENGAIFISGFGGSEVESGAALLETTDSGAAEDFVAKLAEGESDVKEQEYEGVTYRSDGEFAVGLVDETLVAGDPEAFEAAVNASGGDSLADNGDFSDTIDRAPSESLADVYVNVDDFFAAVQRDLDPQSKRFFESFAGQTEGGTALGSVAVPSADRLEIDFLSNAGEQMALGDVTDFLGTFPADSWAAFATPDVGDQLTKAIDQIDEVGIPPDVPPGALKQQLSSSGFDVEQLASAIGDVGVFVSGTDQASIGGALVVTTDDQAAAEKTIADLAKLARQSGTAGLKPTAGGSGFTIRDPEELGPEPLVVETANGRIAFAYGQDAADAALEGGGGETLGSSEVLGSATDALGDAEPAGFVDFGPILTLAESLGATSDPDYAVAKPYLDKLDFLAFGSGEDGDFVTSKIVLALTE